ncbi:hypothetical protein PAXINDRAFT_16299 [Paxillus involutus ATCC 200175]|uniref:Unplaced genomic scaffold PAXINscaffold_75, whole genome shotgun sequence n=1 Tax=Paxillus involutus ATCC 200175 TaxID=664439 RepID=A0A0C9TJ58_PAXIN|nr:hypothetical protein PAXINDRAFT_16299 [Paxillus involutus ATCC 200175]
MHQPWFFTTQGQNDEDVDQLRARQKEHYEVSHDSEEGEEKWDIMCQYYIKTAAGIESGPKSSVGHMMAVQNVFAKSDSEEGPSMPAIGSGGAVNPIEYLCRAGEPVRDRNRRMLKAMLELLIPHGYIKQSILWKRLCHEVENLHFTILNWPEEVPVPDTQFDFYKLDANEVLKLLANFLIN